MYISASEKIKVLLKRKGITQQELAVRCGWSRSNISDRLKRGNFSENNLQKVAEALGCDLSIEFLEK